MWDWIQTNIIAHGMIVTNIFYSLVICIVVLILKKLLMRTIKNKVADPAKQYMGHKICSSGFMTLYLIILLIIWNDSSKYIISFLGMFTAGLAIAMKEVIVNIIGGIYILWAKPFKVGDRIEISGQIGDVIDVGLLEFTLLEVGNRTYGEQSTGRILHLPNMLLFNTTVANYEKGFKYIWHEMVLLIDQSSDWDLAKTLLYEVVYTHISEYIEDAKMQIDTAGEKYLISYNNLTPIIYTEIKGSAIQLTMRYLCEPRKVRTVEHLIWEDILRVLKENDTIKML